MNELLKFYIQMWGVMWLMRGRIIWDMATEWKRMILSIT